MMSNKQKETSHIASSAEVMMNLAKAHFLDATLQRNQPENSLLERYHLREDKKQEEQQQNLESIMSLALSACDQEAASQPDIGWFYEFINIAKNVFNPTMQKLWALVLKHELASPGQISFRSMHTLKSLTPKDAQALQKITRLGCHIGSDNCKKLLTYTTCTIGLFPFSSKKQLIPIDNQKYGVGFAQILLLIELGILHNTEVTVDSSSACSIRLRYKQSVYSLSTPNKETKLFYYRFSPIGNELSSLFEGKGEVNYIDDVISDLNKHFKNITKTSDIDEII
ncbi:TIGR03899 family protein [Vibrio sp.]|nr:TIGR03899 family protein [Vibrio sp.]